MSVATIIAAILLPPLGIFLDRGMGRDFGIATILTILFFLPGMAFALFVVLGGSTARLDDLFARARRPAKA